MKKIISVILCAVMVLSMIPALFVTTASAASEGDWRTCRKPSKDPNPPTYTPAPGYHYTSEGFETINANYKDCGPYFNVMSKERINIKDGFHMEFRIDEFSYGGDSGTADHWIALSIWNADNVSPGSTSWGEGWLSLIRGAGDGGTVSLESWLTTAKDEDAGVAGSFSAGGGTVNGSATADDNGREIYTFDINWVGGAYEIKINDTLIGGSTGAVTKFLEERNKNGEFYIGISLHSGAKDGVAGLTITNVNGAVPTGTDSAEPQENVNIVADPIDPSTVPANTPCMILDGTFSSVNNYDNSSNINGTNMELVAQGDNSFHVTTTSNACYFTWSPKRSLTYLGEQFPVFAMLVRNFENDSGTLWYCGGDVISAQNDCHVPWNRYDEYNLDWNDEEYILIVSDLSDLWEGRINSLRMDFGILDVDDTDYAEFDILWLGMFRSTDEAQAYANEQMKTIFPDAETTEDTKVEETEAADTSAVETTADTTADTTVETKAETTADTTADTQAEESMGCASVIGGAAALVLAAMAAAVALKKH